MIKQDHVLEMKNRLLLQFLDKPVINAIIEVIGEMANDIEVVLESLNDKRWIDTAEGQQLDGCGDILGRPRVVAQSVAIPFFGFNGQTGVKGFGLARIRSIGESYLSSSFLSDPVYRKVLKAKVFKNMSRGTLEDVITSYQNIFDSKVSVVELDNAKLRVGIPRLLTEEEILLANALDLFVKPAGVGVTVRLYYDPEKTFGFKEQGFKGFGQGSFAKTF